LEKFRCVRSWNAKRSSASGPARGRRRVLHSGNADHVDSMVLLARSQAHIEAADATMTPVDRLGFNLRLKTDDGMKGTRINFPREVFSPQDIRAILVEMVRQAQQ